MPLDCQNPNWLFARMPVLNPFEYMEEIHINQIWDELEERFGFPKKEWKKRFQTHLGNQRKGEDDLSVFLKFGNAHINPVLNRILIRNELFPTFNKLCEYVIKKSSIFQKEMNKYKRP